MITERSLVFRICYITAITRPIVLGTRLLKKSSNFVAMLKGHE